MYTYFPLCLRTLCYEKQVNWTYMYLTFFYSYHQLSKSQCFIFFPTFGRILYFCSNNRPLPNVILDLHLRLWFMEKIECLKNCRSYRKLFLKYPTNVKNLNKTVYDILDKPSYLCKSSLLCTILEMDMMSIFPSCVRRYCSVTLTFNHL